MQRQSWLIVAAVLAVGIALGSVAALGGQDVAEPDAGEAGGAVIYATFYPYAELAGGVAEGIADVRQFGPAGSGAHDWEPGAGEIESLDDAVALIHSGEGVETYIGDLESIDSLGHIMFIAASGEHHDDDAGHDDESEHGDEKTHLWLDPVEAIAQVDRIRDALSAIDPANAGAYASNADMYAVGLEGLDARYRDGLAECDHRTIVTFHNAFDAMAARYNLEVLGIAHSHHAEPSVSEIATLVTYLRDSGARAIFSDDLTDGRLEVAAAEEASVDVIALSTLEGLARTDAAGTTYIEKMDTNLDALREGLACR